MSTISNNLDAFLFSTPASGLHWHVLWVVILHFYHRRSPLSYGFSFWSHCKWTWWLSRHTPEKQSQLFHLSINLLTCLQCALCEHRLWQMSLITKTMSWTGSHGATVSVTGLFGLTRRPVTPPVDNIDPINSGYSNLTNDKHAFSLKWKIILLICHLVKWPGCACPSPSGCKPPPWRNVRSRARTSPSWEYRRSGDSGSTWARHSVARSLTASSGSPPGCPPTDSKLWSYNTVTHMVTMIRAELKPAEM